jgi:hypothetical protein
MALIYTCKICGIIICVKESREPTKDIIIDCYCEDCCPDDLQSEEDIEK